MNLSGYSFLVSEVEDNRRIITLTVNKIETGSTDAADAGSADASTSASSGPTVEDGKAAIV